MSEDMSSALVRVSSSPAMNYTGATDSAVVGKKRKKCQDLLDISEKARAIFKDMNESLKLKCPRCQEDHHPVTPEKKSNVTFQCGGCSRLFCSICGQECDASGIGDHVNDIHGISALAGDETWVESERRKRLKTAIDSKLSELSHEPVELLQLFKNHVDSTGILHAPPSKVDNKSNISEGFVSACRLDLDRSIQHGRLSLLSCSIKKPNGIQRHNISERYLIPVHYKLTLVRDSDTGKYSPKLQNRSASGEWEECNLSGVDHKDFPGGTKNLAASLATSVVAIKGAAMLYQIVGRIPEKENSSDFEAVFMPVNSNDGTTCGNGTNKPTTKQSLYVLAFNPNRRLISLQSYISNRPLDEVLFDPLRHSIGASRSMPLLLDMEFPVQESMNELNDDQKRVAHPLYLRTALEVAGPPGTGKTKTITELTQSILACTDMNIIVLSERNGAIDAVAEKFASSCLTVNEDGIIDGVRHMHIWISVVAYGASTSMGQFTRLFTIDEKIRYHPDIVPLLKRETDTGRALDGLLEAQKGQVLAMFDMVGLYLDGKAKAKDAKKLMNTTFAFLKPSDAVDWIEKCLGTVGEVLTAGSSKSVKEISNMMKEASPVLQTLMPEPEDEGKKGHFLLIAERIKMALQNLTIKPIFDRGNAELVTKKYEEAKRLREEKEGYWKKEMVIRARLKISTIASSHLMLTSEQQIHEDKEKEKATDTNDDAHHSKSTDCYRESIEEGDVETNVDRRQAIVVFDEAGCIPAYELLGLPRLGYNIKSLVLVGDKHQLPPFDPGCGRKQQRNRSATGGGRTNEGNTKLRSLLDASQLSKFPGCKVHLTWQYRVPKDIANLLTDRIYQGKYNTAANTKVPTKGFSLIHVPCKSSKLGKNKYVNQDEIAKVLEILERQRGEGHFDCLVLTPYKKQQIEIRSALMKSTTMNAGPSIPVFTIDQCQGQEADVVVISLSVRKPTRFLNRNRLNVALSRVRKRLFVVTDQEGLKEASKDNSWEGYLLAQDLLAMGNSSAGSACKL